MTELAARLAETLGSGYSLDRELTGGGMSRVFVATETALGRRVVVKVLPPDLAAGVSRDRFRREIQLAARLQHPHIVPLLSAGERGDLLWYTMPYIEGESLRHALDRGREFSVREACRIVRDVCEALAFAHERGVIHRDIKPANVLLHGPSALVADFGVAKALSAAMPTTGTSSHGNAMGTPAYMAPEQLAADPAADHRMDIYATGLVAYELLRGAAPFAGISPGETLAARLTREPPALRTRRRAVPPALEALVLRCMHSSPEGRPASAGTVVNALDAILSARLEDDRTVGETAGMRPRRLAVVLATLLCASLIPVFVVVERKQQRARDELRAAAGSTVAPATMLGRGTAAPAISQRLRDRSPTPSGVPRASDAAALQKLRDSLRHAEERRADDSMRTALSAASVRRIVILEPEEVAGWPQSVKAGRTVAEGIRRALAASPQLSVVDSLTSRREELNGVAPGEIAKRLGSPLCAIIHLDVRQGDSAVVAVTLFDFGRKPYWGRTITSRLRARADILTGLDTLIARVRDLTAEWAAMPR